MAAASYDQLLKQVEALKMENSNLRQELEDNSNHLTKLETEASNMKIEIHHWHKQEDFTGRKKLLRTFCRTRKYLNNYKEVLKMKLWLLLDRLIY
uniref:APC regulator of WNT signaling pathway n=1 Tax=Homo sapiens TaxID=9606 RepID=A0AAQ5BGK6_HUMAN